MLNTPLSFHPAQGNLKDSHERELTYLRLSVTDLCNFKCAYCLPNGYEGKKENNELSLIEIERLVAGFAQLGFKKIRITGGEPSLRKDLLDIIRICKQQKGIEKVCITTNGYQLHRFLPAWIDAGIDQVNISIDSLFAKSFKVITSSSELPNIMQAIDNALLSGFTSIKINTVLLNEHINMQVLPLIKWIQDKPISLRFIELMQTGDNKKFFDEQHVSPEKLKQYLRKKNWHEKPREKHSGPARVYSHQDSQGTIGIISPYENHFCDSCNRLRVNAQGNLHLCLFSQEGLPLRQYLKNDSAQDFVDFLNVNIYRKLPSHLLHENQTGITKNLSMLGG